MKKKQKIKGLKSVIECLKADIKRYKTENESLKFRFFEKEIAEMFEREHIIEDCGIKSKEPCKEYSLSKYDAMKFSNINLKLENSELKRQVQYLGLKKTNLEDVGNGSS